MTEPNEIKDVLETMGLEVPVPEAPPAPPEGGTPAEPPPAAAPVAPVEPATPPEPVAPTVVEPPAGLPGEAPPPVVPAAPPVAAAPDPRDLEIEALRVQVMELSKRALVTPTPTPLAAPIPAAPVAPIAPAAPIVPADADIMFFKDEAEVDAALKDAGSFNKFLNNFLRQVEPIISKKATEQALQAVPEVSMRVSTDQINMMSTIQAWYSQNPDLLPFREFCGVVAKEVAAKDPSMTMVKALEETEKEVRSRLRLVKPMNVPPAASGGAPPVNPGFTPGGSSGSGAPGPVLDKVQKDIQETLGL